MHMRVNEPRDHRAATEIYHHCFGSHPAAHLTVRSHRDESTVLDRQRFFNREGRIHGHHFTTHKNPFGGWTWIKKRLRHVEPTVYTRRKEQGGKDTKEKVSCATFHENGTGSSRVGTPVFSHRKQQSLSRKPIPLLLDIFCCAVGEGRNRCRGGIAGHGRKNGRPNDEKIRHVVGLAVTVDY